MPPRPGVARARPAAPSAEDADVAAGARLRGRARLHRQPPEPDAVGRHGPAGLRLPPVIDHRDTEPLRGPVERSGVAALASEEERAKPREVVSGDVAALRILLLDGAERGG